MTIKITIGVCSYKNPQGLAKLIRSLVMQKFDTSRYQVQLLVIDNDCTGANRDLIESMRAAVPFPIEFIEESRKGVCFARNAAIRAAIESACEAFIFVDDDEYAPETWLAAMLGTLETTQTDLVMGPVHGVIAPEVKHWLVNSRVFDKYVYNKKTGDDIDIAYTCNTLLTRKLLQALGPTFHPEFNLTGGEDSFYFTRARIMGYRFTWCLEAVIHEDIPAERVSLRWIGKRNFRAGTTRARSRFMLGDSSLKTVFQIIANGFSYIAHGLLNGIQGILLRDSSIGVKFFTRIAFGCGHLLGLFGFTVKEYDKDYRSHGAAN